MIETVDLSELLDDARHVVLPPPRPADEDAPRPRRPLPRPRGDVVVPPAAVTMLLDYELYVS